VDADLRYALELADAADALTLPRFRATDLRVETKPDLTPVTDADRAVERMLRERIARDRPGDAVLARRKETTAAPFDGSSTDRRHEELLARNPGVSSLIALEREGRVVCGVASAPALGHRWWRPAARGRFATASGSRCRASRRSRRRRSRFPAAASTTRSCSTSRGARGHAQPFSDFWAHLLVAEGAVEISVEHSMSTWDNAALQVIVEEAGGRFSDLHGEARIDGGSGVSTNGLLHDEVLALLKAS